MKIKTFFQTAMAAAVLCASTGAMADGIPDNFALPPGYITFGDGNSYSLQIACVQAGLSNNKCPFFVQSGPGQLKNVLVVATGPDGPVGDNESFKGIDLPYETPNNENAKVFFKMGASNMDLFGNLVSYPDPANGAGDAGTTTGFVDRTSSWDVSLGSLYDYLTGNYGKKPTIVDYGAPVFFFNNNQQGSSGTADENLAAWAKVWITDANGNVVCDETGNCNGYDLTNDLSEYKTFPGGGGVLLGDVGPYTSGITPGGDPRVNNHLTETDYLKSGGRICFKYTGTNTDPAPGDDPVPCSGSYDYFVNNNLGANQAAYAVVFPELNALLAALYKKYGEEPGYTLHVDARLGCDPTTLPTPVGAAGPDIADCTNLSLNNGYEQIFIGRLVPETFENPEPASLALVGLGLLGMGLARRRRVR